jgi:hypothetical protein
VAVTPTGSPSAAATPSAAPTAAPRACTDPELVALNV